MDNQNKKIDFSAKAKEYKSNIVGQGFMTQPLNDDNICVTIVGEIVEGENFEGKNLYVYHGDRFVVWEFCLPDHWQLDNQELLEFDEVDYDNVELDEWNRLRSVTQCSRPDIHKSDEGQMITKVHFCFPFDLQLQVKEKYAREGRFPILLFQINSVDSWDRNKVEGYGMVEVPHSPGFHELKVRTFKPNDDLYTRVFQYFLGGSLKVKELRYLSNTLFKNNFDVDCVLNRYTWHTESSGSMKLRFNVAIQQQKYQELEREKHEKKIHDEKFQKLRQAKRKQPEPQAQSFKQATMMFKGQAGLTNRFVNTSLDR